MYKAFLTLKQFLKLLQTGSINLKTLNYTKISYIERLIEAYNSEKGENSDENGNLQGVINEAMCASLKTRLESGFNDVVMKSGIEDVAKGVFGEVENRNKVKIHEIKQMAKQIKSEKDVNQKSKLEVEFIKKVNEVVFNQDLFKYISAADKVGTEVIQTLSKLTEEQKYEVNCTTHIILQEIFFLKYLNRYLLAGNSDDHFLAIFQTSSEEVYAIDRKNPIKISYNLNERGVQNESDYHQGKNNRQWLLVGDLETMFLAIQYDWKGIRQSELKNYSQATKYHIKANRLTNFSNPICLANLGIRYAFLNDFVSAEKYFIEVNKLTNWSNTANLNNLGLNYYNLNDNKAILTFKKTLEIDKENTQALYALSYIHSLKKEKEQMLQHLQKAVNKDKKYKQIAKEDTDFEKYWNDKDFKRIVDN